MAQRAAGLGVLGIASIFVLAVLAATGFGTVNSWATRISFAIATGPSSGTYFPVGETIAGLVSHPPGVDRCDRASKCGPEGLIATAQTSPGSYANIVAVNTGRIDSALAQSDVVAEAVRGTGAFRNAPQKHLRVIATLYPEQIHIVARRKLRIASVSALRGKRISIGLRDSGTSVTARRVLAAYRVAGARLSNDSADSAAQKLQAGKIDAFFFVGGAPIPLVQALLADGQAELVPIDGTGAQRLIAQGEGLYPDSITPAIYSVERTVPTLSIESLWIVNDQEPPDVVFSLTRALFDSSNRPLLDQGPSSMRHISIAHATQNLPAPLHPGAARYYKEAGARATYVTPLR